MTKTDLPHGKTERSTVSLRVSGPDLEPQRITELLRIQPTHAHKQGDRISQRVPNLRKAGMWTLTIEWAEGDLSSQVNDLLSRVTSDVDTWTQISSTYTADVFCGVSFDHDLGTFALDSQVVEALSKRGLSIWFDVYFLDPADDDDPPPGNEG